MYRMQAQEPAKKRRAKMSKPAALKQESELMSLAKISHIASERDVARLVINNNKVLSGNNISGLIVTPKETKEGVDISIKLKKGTNVKKPVHMCFGVLDDRFTQKIKLKVEIEDDAHISVFGHCIFPKAVKVKHFMDGKINIGKNSSFNYFERHLHSDTGGVEVYPKAVVNVGRNSRYKTEFELLKGRVGLIDIDYETFGEENSKADMIARISAYGDDIIKVKEHSILNGDNSAAVLRSRVAVRDDAKAEVFNRIIAKGAYSRGHVDCTEILHGKGSVKAYPEVEVLHPKARVTHEAKLGGIDNKQLETLMARGLSEQEAEEIIIEGLLS